MTSRQPERRYRCVAVLTGRRWDKRLRFDPLEATAFAGCRIADLIGAQGGEARIVVIAVHGANARCGTRFDPRDAGDLPPLQQRPSPDPSRLALEREPI